ncbi:uncharacterized protein LOC128963151 [Oppia nitens]|uniref:uncharacterized protein LOC128963151 n=1 Tax=Oppia nitens TaxID=1686743 RepID=UPI0023DC8C74|nr:uncharacterized protein LOC128963151 [Oppia nitens]
MSVSFNEHLYFNNNTNESFVLICFKQQSEKFWSMFDNIVDKVLKNIMTTNDETVAEQMKPHLQQIIGYYKGSKTLNPFGFGPVMTYSLLTGHMPSDPLFDTNVYALGWVGIMLSNYYFLLDDIMDNSTNRLGKQCWHTLPSVGLSALNDSTLLLSVIHKIIRLYYESHPYYVNMVKLMTQLLGNISLGQQLDMIYSQMPQSNNFKYFTIKGYVNKNKYKNAYFGLLMQFKFGLYASGRDCIEHQEIVEEKLILLGVLDGAINDYEDLNKEGGTDIQEGKFSWLVVRALELADDRQRAIIVDNYGRVDDQCVQQIRQLYNELNLKHEFLVYANQVFDDIHKFCLDFNDNLVTKLLTNFADLVKQYLNYAVKDDSVFI